MKKIFTTLFLTLSVSVLTNYTYAQQQFCETQQGKTLNLFQSERTRNDHFPNEMEICHFAPNAYIASQTLSDGVAGQPSTAIDKFLRLDNDNVKPDMWNPAYTYCLKVGGTIVNYIVPNKGELGMCYFDDGSSIGQWSLLRQDKVIKDLLPN